MPDGRVVNLGRTVYLDGCAIAEASDAVAAELIALAIRHVGLAAERIPPPDARRLEEILA